MSNVITITTEELQKLIQKEVNAKVGSMSVKGKVRELPGIDIGGAGKLEAAIEASGHKLSTVMIADYQPVTKNEKTDSNWGGYSFISSPEKLAFKQKPVFWIKTAGLSGKMDLDTISKTLEAIRVRKEVVKLAYEGLVDYEAGFESLFRNMTENID